jgi:tetratricopeptide (TPR) repeat protein
MVTLLASVHDRGDYRTASDLGREAVERTEAAGFADLEARASQLYGAVLRRLGLHEESREAFERSLRLYEDLGDWTGISRSHRSLGVLARFRGDLDLAWDHLQRCVALEPLIGEDHQDIGTWFSLGVVAWLRGDMATAQDLYVQTLKHAQKRGDLAAQATCPNGMAELARSTGDYEAAERGYRASIALHWETGSAGLTLSRFNLGQVQLFTGRIAQAREQFLLVERAVEREGRLQLKGILGLAQLACDADTLGPSAFNTRWKAATGQLQEIGMVEPDVAGLAEWVGDRALLGNRVQRARVAWA